jgi:hypothetical protein
MTLKDQRVEQLIKCIPDVYDYDSVLYIGAKVKHRWPKGMEFCDKFSDAEYWIDVIEAWPPNVQNLNTFNKKGYTFKEGVEKGPGTFRKIYLADVSEIPLNRAFDKHRYDIVFWWHGPEHVEEDKLMTTLVYLERLATKLIITGCPWGVYRQKAVGGNEFELHKSVLYPEFFQKMGWKTATLGEKDLKKSNILAWLRKT